MKRIGALLVATILASTAAMAQEGNPYNGNWAAHWQGGKRLNDYTANVVIQDHGGTFQNLASSSRSPCMGIKAPIEVTTATADELVFVIKFSTALKVCRDTEVKLKRVDDKTLKGTKGKKTEITLIRK